MKKEDLITQGLTEEQAKFVMSEHGKTITTLNKKIESLEGNEKTLQTQLNENNKKLKELSKQEGNSQELNDKIKELQDSNVKLTEELKTNTKKYAVESALQAAGATDVEYLAYKLGDVELDKDGKIKDLDSKIKDLQANNPNFFEPADPAPDDKKDQPDGFKTIDNKLNDGQQTKSFTQEQIASMSAEEINKNWEAISASLENGGN